VELIDALAYLPLPAYRRRQLVVTSLTLVGICCTLIYGWERRNFYAKRWQIRL